MQVKDVTTAGFRFPPTGRRTVTFCISACRGPSGHFSSLILTEVQCEPSISVVSGRLSPDGKWLAYASSYQSDRSDVFVERFQAAPRGNRSRMAVARTHADRQQRSHWAPPRGILP